MDESTFGATLKIQTGAPNLGFNLLGIPQTNQWGECCICDQVMGYLTVSGRAPFPISQVQSLVQRNRVITLFTRKEDDDIMLKINLETGESYG
jgi:hypothetical protein